MYGANLRAYGEYFAEKQGVTTGLVGGNKAENNPTRLDAAQGGTAVRVAVSKDGTLTIPNGGSFTLYVLGAKTAEATPVLLGTAAFANDTGSPLTLGPDAFVCEFIPGQELQKRPYVSVKIQGSNAFTGTVDVFPHYISHPRRG